MPFLCFIESLDMYKHDEASHTCLWLIRWIKNRHKCNRFITNSLKDTDFHSQNNLPTTKSWGKHHIFSIFMCINLLQNQHSNKILKEQSKNKSVMCDICTLRCQISWCDMSHITSNPIINILQYNKHTNQIIKYLHKKATYIFQLT